MKTEDLIALGIAAVALYFVAGSRTAAAPRGGIVAAGDRPVLLANNADPTEPGWGWSYYSDGTAISPEGFYYKNGVRVWAPY